VSWSKWSQVACGLVWCWNFYAWMFLMSDNMMLGRIGTGWIALVCLAFAAWFFYLAGQGVMW
jgi:hypothetical protein